MIDGANIESYRLKEPREFVYFIPSAIKSGGNLNIYLQDRVCVRQIGETPIATLVSSGIFALNTVYNIYKRISKEIDLHFVLAIVNSKLNKYHWRKFNYDQKGTFPKIKKDGILKIPVRLIITKEEKHLHDQLVRLVTQMLEAKKNLQTAKTERDKTFLENKCTSLDRQIDNLVYQLYGLTEDEIKIVEER